MQHPLFKCSTSFVVSINFKNMVLLTHVSIWLTSLVGGCKTKRKQSLWSLLVHNYSVCHFTLIAINHKTPPVICSANYKKLFLFSSFLIFNYVIEINLEQKKSVFTALKINFIALVLLRKMRWFIVMSYAYLWVCIESTIVITRS